MRTFIEKMREEGRVIDIETPCSTVFEAPKLASKTDDLIFFHNLDGDRKGVMNVTASRASLSCALGIPEHDIVPRLAATGQNGVTTEGARLSMGAPDLGLLPVMKHFPLDAGRYLTSAVVFSQYGGVENASIHRMQVVDERRLAARLVEGRHTHSLLQDALADGERLPVAITIGTHPAVTFASCTRVPQGKEMQYAAELLGGEIELNTCSNGVRVPDGYIGSETTAEGPFVDITGTYDPIRQGPVIEITGMQMKPDAIYHGILPAGNEHKILMGMFRSKRARRVMPRMRLWPPSLPIRP
jgi:anhydromevalonate phosphate decarboxylase